MKFDTYMHDSMREIAQDVQADPMLRARVMNRVQLQRTKYPPAPHALCPSLPPRRCAPWSAAHLRPARSSAWLRAAMQATSLTAFSDESKVEEQVGFDVRLPETLNGAAFTGMQAMPIDAIDADGHTVYYLPKSSTLTMKTATPSRL